MRIRVSRRMACLERALCGWDDVRVYTLCASAVCSVAPTFFALLVLLPFFYSVATRKEMRSESQAAGAPHHGRY